MNSKAAQLTEDGTEIVRLFARFALGASFLSAVADRFGMLGPYGAKNVSWGDFAHFVEYTGAVMSLFPRSLTVSFAWAATVAETLLGILLIAGFKVRISSVLSGLLLLSFAMGMATGLGIKTPLDYSIFSAAAAAFLLAFWEPDRFTLDNFWVDHETAREIQVKTQTRRRMWHGVVNSRRWLDNPFDVPEQPSRLFHSRFREAGYIRLIAATCTHARLSYSDVAVLHLSKIIPSKKAFGRCCELGWPLPQSTVELRRELTLFVFPKLTGVADGVRT